LKPEVVFNRLSEQFFGGDAPIAVNFGKQSRSERKKKCGKEQNSGCGHIGFQNWLGAAG
jgi:hypothetical protein